MTNVSHLFRKAVILLDNARNQPESRVTLKVVVIACVVAVDGSLGQVLCVSSDSHKVLALGNLINARRPECLELLSARATAALDSGSNVRKLALGNIQEKSTQVCA